jgi:hypothetical protein
VLQIREYLLTSADPLDLMMCVMMILGINLFLRFDEICNMRLDQFLPNLTQVEDDGMVKAIFVTVQVRITMYLIIHE